MKTAIGPGQGAGAVLAYIKQRAAGKPPTEDGITNVLAAFPNLGQPLGVAQAALSGTMIKLWLGQQALRFGLIYLKHFIHNAKEEIAANKQDPLPESETANPGETLNTPKAALFKHFAHAVGRVFKKSALDAAAEWYDTLAITETGPGTEELFSLFQRGNHAARPRAEAMQQGPMAWTVQSLNPAFALVN